MRSILIDFSPGGKVIAVRIMASTERDEAIIENALSRLLRTDMCERLKRIAKRTLVWFAAWELLPTGAAQKLYNLLKLRGL